MAKAEKKHYLMTYGFRNLAEPKVLLATDGTFKEAVAEMFIYEGKDRTEAKAHFGLPHPVNTREEKIRAVRAFYAFAGLKNQPILEVLDAEG